MGKRRSNHSVTTGQQLRGSSGITDTPAATPAVPPNVKDYTTRSFVLFVGSFGLLTILGLGWIVWSTFGLGRPTPTTITVVRQQLMRSWNPKSAADQICADFLARRKANDPAALALLGREPSQPAGDVSEAEAERLQTDFFLRDADLHIVAIYRDTEENQYILVTKGNVSAPRLDIRHDDGELTSEQRTMSNPDLAVEVRDGKIFGVRSTLHRD